MKYQCIGRFMHPSCGKEYDSNFDFCPRCGGIVIKKKEENKMSIYINSFSSEEKKIIYEQLSARKRDFKEMALEAGKKEDFDRMKECVDFITKLDTIMKKCLDNNPIPRDVDIEPNSSSGVNRN